MATRVANPIAIPARRVERVHARRWVAAFAALALLALLSLVYLRQASAVASAGYDIRQLEEQKKLWQAKNEQLSFQIAQLRSLSRVERDAAARLGMGRPETVVYVAPSASTREAAASSRAGERELPAAAEASGPERSSAPTLFDVVGQWLPFAQPPAEPASMP